jgi:hypothetical protein
MVSLQVVITNLKTAVMANESAFLFCALTKVNKTNEAINSIEDFNRITYNFSNLQK